MSSARKAKKRKLRKRYGHTETEALTDGEFEMLRRVFAAGGSILFELSQGKTSPTRLRTSTYNKLLSSGLIESTAVRAHSGAWHPWRYRVLGTAAGARAYHREEGRRTLAAEGIRL